MRTELHEAALVDDAATPRLLAAGAGANPEKEYDVGQSALGLARLVGNYGVDQYFDDSLGR